MKLPTINEDAEFKRMISAARDSERIDWIAKQGGDFAFGIIQDAPGDGNWFVHGMDCDNCGEGRSFREAIDSAMKRKISNRKAKSS